MIYFIYFLFYLYWWTSSPGVIRHTFLCTLFSPLPCHVVPSSQGKQSHGCLSLIIILSAAHLAPVSNSSYRSAARWNATATRDVRGQLPRHLLDARFSKTWLTCGGQRRRRRKTGCHPRGSVFFGTTRTPPSLSCQVMRGAWSLRPSTIPSINLIKPQGSELRSRPTPPPQMY